MGKTAILVDGGFYRKRAAALFGNKSPEQRADELVEYCKRHLKVSSKNEPAHYRELYRIMYYDCQPLDKVIYHPLTQRSVNLKSNETYSWTKDFFKALSSKRKVAIRLGELLEGTAGYTLKPESLKRLCKKTITIDDLTEDDFKIDIQQKGVDMKIGLDIASLSQKKLVDQIVLIAGDSDFVPAAKHARREGIDFILDPMWHAIKDSLYIHVDGLNQKVSKPPYNVNDKLHVSNSKNDNNQMNRIPIKKAGDQQ